MFKLVIPMKPRNVILSKELKLKISDKKIPKKYITALKTIIEEFKRGGDLNPCLSKHFAFQPKNQDGLLYDWKIQHLHLSTEKWSSTDYLNKRTEYELIFYLNDNDVYLIDIRKHPHKAEWADEDFINILEKNWPELLKNYRLDFFSSTDEITMEDRSEFRKKGVFTFIEANSKVYIPPGGGIASDKSSISANMEKNHILEILNNFESDVKDGSIEMSMGDGSTLPKSPEFKLIVYDDELCVHEEKTKSLFTLGIPWFEYK